MNGYIEEVWIKHILIGNVTSEVEKRKFIFEQAEKYYYFINYNASLHYIKFALVFNWVHDIS